MMHIPAKPLGTIAIAIACSLLGNARPASAITFDQTWVSMTGADNGGCSFSSPCRTVQHAFDLTNTAGLISVINSGTFGPLNITKSITVVGDGVEVSILSFVPGASITVNAPGGVVVLRGLTIAPSTGAHIGISFIAGATLHVYDCVIRKASNGIRFAPATGTSELYVADTVIENTTSTGIDVRPTGSGSAKAMFERVRVENTANIGIGFSGTTTTGTIRATVSDSVAAGNAGTGFRADESGGGTTNVTIDRSASVNNSTGIYVSGAGATIQIGDSTVSGNTTKGLTTVGSGVIASYGTNKVNGNVIDGSPTTSIAPK